MSTFKVVISHFSFLISQTKQRLLINLLKGQNLYYQYCKSFTCGENFDKKYYFFPGSVFENKIVKQISNHTNRSATMKKKQQQPH